MTLTATVNRKDGRVIPLGPAEPAGSIGMDVSLQGTMPGGQTSASLTVARDPILRELDPFDELVIRESGGTEVWSGYGVEYPARDGEGPQVEISATGWSGYLKDNPPPPLVAVDRAFDKWTGPEAGNRAVRVASGWVPDKGITASADQGGLLFASIEGASVTANNYAELWYQSSLAPIGSIGYKATAKNRTNITNDVPLYDNGPGFVSVTYNGTVQHATFAGPSKYVFFSPRATTTFTPAAGSGYVLHLTGIAVYGNHGIPLYDNGDDGFKGVLASDVIAWGLQQTCPLLTAEITPTTFVIPQLVEPDLDDMEALILKVNATEMFDWGCFGKRFVYRPAGGGRTWVVRAADPGVSLTDAGTQGEDLYTRAIVSYGDFGGRSLKAGYIGSGCDTESAALSDTTNNVLTQRGRPRTLKLSLTAASTAARATQAGQVALQEMARLSLRGDATLTGSAQDTNGVWRPITQIQAGDQIIFADRSWTPRRIVDLNYTEDTDTCAISLDSTPARLDAILERMGVINESNNI